MVRLSDSVMRKLILPIRHLSAIYPPPPIQGLFLMLQ